MPSSSSSIYDITQTFEQNATFGPFWSEKLPKLPARKPHYTFLGQKMNSLFGVSACPLTVNARYINLLSQLGYDLLTYKSVRSIEWRGNVFPHWMYVDAPKQLTSPDSNQKFTARFEPFGDQDPSMLNSFGIHSLKPEYWQEDFEVAQQKIQKGQLLILSLMPSPIPGQTLVDDGKKLAELANQTSAQVFEVNFACPNTDGGGGLIYDDLDLTFKICTAMKKVLGKKPLLVKVGYYKNQADLKKFMELNKDLIAGISTTNTYNMTVVDEENKQVLPGRPMAGVSGAAARTLSMAQAKNAVQFKKEMGLKDFVIIGTGGVTKPEHIQQYLDLGVDAVQTAVGAWADPFLASKYLKTVKEE